MRDPGALFVALSQSTFRQRFRLGQREQQLLETRGLDTVLAHARDFIHARLAPAEPVNDGAQTPMRNHPVFIAQHATATCCRCCLWKWHLIPPGRTLSEDECDYIVGVIRRWLLTRKSGAAHPAGAAHVEPERQPDRHPDLFDDCS